MDILFVHSIMKNILFLASDGRDENKKCFYCFVSMDPNIEKILKFC
jgi:hypothetical protein